MRTKEQIIELIREGKLVLDIEGFQFKQTAIDVLNKIKNIGWYADGRYYGTVYSGNFRGLLESELNNREIVTLQEYLDSPSLSEVPTRQFEGSREYDEKLINEFHDFINNIYYIKKSDVLVEQFLDKRYNSDLLKEKEQLEQRLKEINEQLKK